jgi:hypothetical protein
MKEINILEDKIKELYSPFFKKLNIDKNTGILNKDKYKKRFATYPYIGSNYGKYKILFIGLDIGSDHGSIKNSILSFSDKRSELEESVRKNNQHMKYNPHISGLMITTIYLLKNKNKKYNDFWNKINNEKSMVTAVKKWIDLDNNPVSLTSLTNIHKFVTINRTNKLGNEDRKFINKDIEKKLLIDEINIFKPKYIILQSSDIYYRKLLDEIISEILAKTKIYIIPHPSARNFPKNPQKYIEKLEKIN